MPGKTIVVSNPAGTITNEALMAVKLGIENPPSKIMVNGEEDLLALPCIVYAPDNTAIYYGQRNEGIVKITVNSETKQTVKEIINSMREVNP